MPSRVRGTTPDDNRGAAPSYLLPPFPHYRSTGNKGLTKRNGVAEMTAVVSREHARGAYLTGAAGIVMIAIACLMMVVAAPGHATTPGHATAPGPAQPAGSSISSAGSADPAAPLPR
jgi:hypothetical protein